MKTISAIVLLFCSSAFSNDSFHCEMMNIAPLDGHWTEMDVTRVDTDTINLHVLAKSDGYVIIDQNVDADLIPNGKHRFIPRVKTDLGVNNPEHSYVKKAWFNGRFLVLTYRGAYYVFPKKEFYTCKAIAHSS